ncbi:MAG: DNA polymerase III subunit beta [Coriobacteriia bacterium]|nr:DNA polymerase III subunit beta [Coriobacteriia bacterium]
MKFSVARGELVDALSAVSRGLSSRSTLPILSGILFSAEESGAVTLQATDLEVSVKNALEANVSESGQSVLPGRLVADIVRALPEAAVEIQLTSDAARIECGTSSFSVRTLPAEDFPRFPEVEGDKSVVLDTKTFTSAVTHVSKAVSRDETRPILTGVLVCVEGPSLRMVATDSYRLAVKEIVLSENAGAEANVVIPGKALDEVARLASGVETITFSVSDSQIVFEVGRTVFVTRRIDGTFPNYKQLIPQETETKVAVSREEMLQAVRRVSLLAQHNSPLRISIQASEQTMTLSATTQDVGDASEALMVKAEGTDVEIAFNHAFLADGLAAAEGEDVALEMVSPLKPGVLRATQDEGFLYLLMPVRLG